MQTVKIMAAKTKTVKISDRASQRNFELSKQDISDQKKISDTIFCGSNGHLHMLTEDLRAESVACRGWSDLLTFKLKNGSKVSLLDNFMSITKRDLLDQQARRSPAMVACARNMYIALWCTLGAAPKSKILSHTK